MLEGGSGGSARAGNGAQGGGLAGQTTNEGGRAGSATTTSGPDAASVSVPRADAAVRVDASTGDAGSTAPADPRIQGLRLVVGWDGTQKDATVWLSPSGGGNQATRVTGVERSHSLDAAQEWRAADGTWVENGMFWKPTIDIKQARYFSAWIKVISGQPPKNLNIGWHSPNAGCGRGGFTYPLNEGGPEIRIYNAQWSNGTWQQVIIPVADIHKGQTECMASADGLAIRGSGSSFTLLYDDVGFYF